MSEEQKARDDTLPVAKDAPAASGNKETPKDQSEHQHSFQDWASI